VEQEESMATARMSLVNPHLISPRYIPEDYPLIRSVADPRIANLPTEDLEAELLRQGIRAEDMEGLFDDVGHAFSSAGRAIGNVVSTAAPVVAQVAGKALPGIISGAVTGCALGPWGCLGGALVGGVTSALSGGGGQPAGARPSSPIGAIASAIPAIAGAIGGGGGAVSGLASALPAIAGLVGGGGGGAPGGAASVGTTNPAGVLLGLVQRPELIQSLMSMALGSAGRKDIPVGNSSVPVSAFANLLSALGSKAFGQAEAFAEPSESLPDYLYKGGTLAVDPAVPSQRAAALLERLGEVAIPTVRPRGSMLSGADEYYDELDAAELDLMELEGANYEFDD
jgi:hypothetical protein